jgi:hypothetical protein
LGDPWGIVTAVLLGGLGGAVAAALGTGVLFGLPIGVGIAAGVYGIKVGLGAFTDRTPAAAGTPGLPTPPRGSAAERWLRRADAALLTGSGRGPAPTRCWPSRSTTSTTRPPRS